MTAFHNRLSGNWNDPGTWYQDKIPTADDNVFIDGSGGRNTATLFVEVTGSDHAKAVTITDLGVLDLNGVLEVEQSFLIKKGGILQGMGTLSATTIDTQSGSTINVDEIGVGLSLHAEKGIDNGGTINAYGFLQIYSPLNNLQSGIVNDTSLITASGVKNSGYIDVDGSGANFKMDSLENTMSGTIKVFGLGSRIDVGSVINKGFIQAGAIPDGQSGQDAEYGAIGFHGNVSNTFIIETYYQGTIIFDHGLTNDKRGFLEFTGSHGTVTITQAAIGGKVEFNGDHGVLNLGGSNSSINIEFGHVAETKNRVNLEHSETYNGKIIDWTVGSLDALDFTDQNFSTSHSYNPSSHILTVGTAHVQIVGTYQPGDFHFGSDGSSGGTLVSV